MRALLRTVRIAQRLARAVPDPDPTAREWQEMERSADAHNAPILKTYTRLVTQRVTLSAAPLAPFAARCDFDRYASSLLRDERAYEYTVGTLLVWTQDGRNDGPLPFPPLHPQASLILIGRLGLKRSARWEEIADACKTSVERCKAIKRMATLRFSILSRDLPDNLAEFSTTVYESTEPFMARTVAEARGIAEFGWIESVAELVRMEAQA